MDTHQYSDKQNHSQHLVEVRKLWGFNYYVEVTPTETVSSTHKILEIKEPSEGIYTNVFGGDNLD